MDMKRWNIKKESFIFASKWKPLAVIFSIIFLFRVSQASDMILMFDSSASPQGWDYLSDMDNRFPLCDSASCGDTGGSTTHSHGWKNSDFIVNPVSSYRQASTGTGLSLSFANHTHGIKSYSCNYVYHLPPYKDICFCKFSGIPNKIPEGAIAIFDTPNLPTGWTRYSALDNRFPRGNTLPGTLEGTSEHSHSITIKLNTDIGGTLFKTGSFSGGALSGHSHTATGNTDSVSNLPPYCSVIYAKCDVAMRPPRGMIAIFNEKNFPHGWSYVDALHGRFPMGDTNFGITGGNSSHRHFISINSTPYSGSLLNSGGVYVSYAPHKHLVEGYTLYDNNVPPYFKITFAKLTNPILLVSPYGGEIWKGGTTHQIVWNDSFTTSISKIKLLYSTDEGITFPHLIEEILLPSDTVYDWFVPNINSSQVRVKCIAWNASDSSWDISGNNFTIYIQSIEEKSLFPDEFVLFSPSPNPFLKNITIKYGLPQKSNVSLALYDISGRLVKILSFGTQEKGYHTVNIREDEFVKGVYFVKFKAGDYKETKKLVLMK